MKTALSIIAILLIALTLLGKAYFEKTQGFSRMSNNVFALTQENTFVKAKNGELITQNAVLRLKPKEAAKAFPQVKRELENMGIRPGNVLSYSSTVTEQNLEIKAPLQDTNIVTKYDTILAKKFEWNDKWNSVEGIATPDTQYCKIKGIDSITTVINFDRFLGFLWPRLNTLKSSIINKNPHNKIVNNQTIINK